MMSNAGSFYKLPLQHHKHMKSSNMLERLLPNNCTFSTGFVLVNDFDGRNGNDPLASPFPYIGGLLDDFGSGIPRPNEDVIRSGFPDPVRRMDRNMGAWEEPTLFVRVPINCIVDEIGSHSAIIEQCIRLAGCSVTHDRLTRLFRSDQEFQEFPLLLLHALPERSVILQRIHPHAIFLRDYLCHALPPLLDTRMAGVNAKGATVRGNFLHVIDAQTVLRE